ncbi:unnamed protein product, partial [Polarella glacialis]
MVRIVNGQIGGGSGQPTRSKGLLDVIADFFWSIVAFFVLFFETMLKPREGGPLKPTGKRKMAGFGRGPGSNNISPPGGGG